MGETFLRCSVGNVSSHCSKGLSSLFSSRKSLPERRSTLGLGQPLQPCRQGYPRLLLGTSTCHQQNRYQGSLGELGKGEQAEGIAPERSCALCAALQEDVEHSHRVGKALEG